MTVTNISVDWCDQSIKVFANLEPSLIIEIISTDFKVKGRLPMAITIMDDQTFEATVSAVDSRGNPARIDGDPAWTVSDPALLSLTINGAQAIVSAAGPLGVGQLRVSVDADLGEGVRPLTGLLDIEVIGGEAVGLTIVPTAPHR